MRTFLQERPIGDILSVEQQISEVESQTEQLQGQINVMNDQTSYSAISVTVTEPATKTAVVPPAPRTGLERSWDRARSSFTHGVEDVTAASGGIAMFLLFAIVVALGGRLVWLRTRRWLL